ncbi:hypothetical protein RD792_018071, partial [Penstemon davidsonii]
YGMEYGFGAHDYPTSGVFEVEPRSCPGFIFRRSILLGSTDMSRSELRSFMEQLSNKYHGDTYHWISKNCNHFTDDVCQRLTGKSIPGWVNRLARLGVTFYCPLNKTDEFEFNPILESSEILSIDPSSNTNPSIKLMLKEDGTDSAASSVSGESEDDGDHHLLLTSPNSDVAYLKDRPVRLAKDVL